MKLTKEMLIDWIDRPPSNSDLDLINYIIDMQNNRDDSIEMLETYKRMLSLYSQRVNIFDLQDVIDELRGDSDENRNV